MQTSIVYWGSAGPGTLTSLYPAVTGVFLGRFAHDPGRVAEVLDEAGRLTDRPGAAEGYLELGGGRGAGPLP